MNLIKRFENWFNVKFGWFFTNGMKTQYTDLKKTNVSEEKDK